MSKYNNNFITNAVLRVDFPPILGLNKDNPPIKFQEQIQDRFPIIQPVTGKFVEFRVGKEEPAMVSEIETVKWQFFNKQRTKVLEVAAQSITHEFFIYNDFPDFSDSFEWSLTRFFKIYDVVKISNRIGLRYINQIKIEKGNPFDWTKLINSDLVLVDRDFVKQSDGIKKSMHLLEFKVQGYDLKFQFGMFNSEYPNPIARKEFVLDYDCVLKEDCEISEIYIKANEFNKIITKWFEKSIGDELRDLMVRKNE